MAPTNPPATAPPAYTSVTLGSGSDSFTITLPTFPPPTADAVYKKVALRAAFNAIEPHILATTTRSVFDALSTVVPLDLTAIDHECNTICQELQAHFLRPDHPSVTHSATDFLNRAGQSVPASFEIASRSRDAKTISNCLHYVEITASAADMSPFHPNLASMGPTSVSYLLELPISSDPNPTTNAAALGPTNLGTTLGGTPPVTSPSIPASMRSSVSSSSSRKHRNYYGNFDFLDSRAAFDATFGSTNPPVVVFDATNKRFTRTTKDPLPDLTRTCYFACFTSLLERDYVGAEISNAAATQAIFYTLSTLTYSRFDHATKKKTYHTPTDILQSFLSLVPTLDSSSPASIARWPNSLAQQFVTNLSPEVRKRIYTGRSKHTILDHSALTTLTAQSNELRKLAEAAQEIFDDEARFIHMRSDHNSLRNQVSSFVTQQATLNPTPGNPTPSAHAQPHVLLSPAESVLTRYNPQASAPSTALVYPVDPYSDDQYQSRFPTTFRGCFRCGGIHLKLPNGNREPCPEKGVPGSRERFFKEYFAHFPDKRHRYDNGQDVVRDTQGRIIYPPPSSSTTTTRSHVQFASTDTDDNPNPSQRVRQYVTFAHSLHVQPTRKLRPIPVTISDHLPTIEIQLGPTANTSPYTLPTLLDTCASITSGSYAFHKRIAQAYPACVAFFVESDDDLDPFEVIRLTGAIYEDEDAAALELSRRGCLRAVVSYNMHYKHSDGGPCVLNIALGTDVSVDTIVGWPFIQAVDGLIDARNYTFLARELSNTSFPILCGQPTLSHPPPPLPKPRQVNNLPAWLDKPQLPPSPPSPPLAQTTDTDTPDTDNPDTSTASTSSDIYSATFSAPTTDHQPQTPVSVMHALASSAIPASPAKLLPASFLQTYAAANQDFCHAP